MSQEELVQGLWWHYHGAEGRRQLVNIAGGGENEDFVAQGLRQLAEYQLQHLPVGLLREEMAKVVGSLDLGQKCVLVTSTATRLLDFCSLTLELCP